jgi:uncharacterized membrane protein
MSGHSHSAHAYDVVVGRIPRIALLSFLAVVGLATILGVWKLWPDPAQAPTVSDSAAFGAPGVTFPHARVSSVQPACPLTKTNAGQGPDSGYRPSRTCGNINVRLAGTGRAAGSGQVTVQVPPEVSRSGLRTGDSVQLVRTPAGQGHSTNYTYFTTDRHVSLFWFAAIFAVVVIAVARWRGLMALITLIFGAVVITRFMLPALLAGESGLWVAVAGSSAIMFVILYATHGPNLRTSAALAGTLLGIAITAGVGDYAIHANRLTGISDETGGTLSSFVTGLSFPGLLTCGLIVAGLGVLNDVTITQSSSVWELRSAAPEMPRRQVFTAAMRIGRDHIASTIYTIVFAYAGASMIVLLLLAIYNRPLLDLLSNEAIAEEVVRTLASALGLVLAVPITTAIAAAAASPSPGPAQRGWDRDPTGGDPFRRFWGSSRH